MKKNRTAAMALAALLTLSTETAVLLAETPDSGTETEETQEIVREEEKKGGKQTVDEPENAIGKEAAEEIALKEAGVSAEEAGRVKTRVKEMEDGTVVYKVSFHSETTKYSVKVNALSGEIAEKTTEEVSEDAMKESTHEKKKQASKQEEPENAIGKDAAKEIALRDAGISAEDAGKARARLSEAEDGTILYRVRFTCNGETSHYRIDAISGEIIEKSTEAASEKTSETKKKKTAEETAAEV